MFSKIKDRLKNVFSKGEELIEENPDEEVEIVEEVKEKKPKKEKSQPKKESKPKVKDKPKEEEVSESKEKLEEKKPEEIIEEDVQVEETPKKKGFFSKVFGKKEEKDVEELEDIQDEMLEGVDEEEKQAIKERKPIKDTQENKKKLEKQIEKEELVEKEELDTDDEADPLEEPQEKEGFFSRTFKKVKSKKIDEDDYEKIWVELELFLLEINIAYEIVQKIDEKLKERLIGNSFNRFNLTTAIREVLETEVEEVLKGREADFLSDIKGHLKQGGPVKILVLGVNGTGKTTTIAKIVKYLNDNKLTCVVAAADTFRAAAIEQLEEHSKKLNFKLIRHQGGSDPAAVAFDAIEHAKAKKLDVVLVDTAGRMPNNSNLMMELQKVKKVTNSQMAIFIGDSISGNDLIDQIELFDKGVEISGCVLTKTDTDERPGSIVTTAYSIEKPIYFLGVGQTYDDLIVFDSKHVAEQLFKIDED